MRRTRALAPLLLAACSAGPNQYRTQRCSEPRSAASASPAIAAGSQTPTTPAPSTSAPAGQPLADLGIDETAIDPSIDPCDDFYQYACGSWIKRTEIPVDRSRWVRSFSVITENNLVVERSILEADAAHKANPKDRYPDKLGDFYASCTDEAAIEKSASGDLATELAKVDAIDSLLKLADAIAHLHLGLANAAFSVGSQQDYANATEEIGVVDQGGLGLPDRDYYLSDKFKKERDAYQVHVGKMLWLAGESQDKAAADEKTVLAVETQLAKAAMDRILRREPKNVYHRINLVGLEKAAPHFPWKRYFTALGHPSVTQLNVANPEYFTALDGMLQKVPLAEWKTYLRWHVVHGAAPALSKAFVDENFRFFGKTLQGVEEIEPRWKRCVEAADGAMGEALGQAFVRETFGEQSKAQTREMVKGIEAAMLGDLGQLQWMDAPTRKAALEKLAAINNKIAYPDSWRSYDALAIARGSYLKNLVAATEFETHRQLAKIGKPVDKGEWEMSPPTVNAYYDPSLNEMVFPAGILQPPFYAQSAARPVNYGAIGMVMGHELTHGFDDEGRRFDGQGNLREWWTAPVSAEFDRRAQCVVDQFDGYTATGDVHVKGKLTLGENIADLGGIKLAIRAFEAAKVAQPAPGPKSRFTDEQLFFLGTAQAWCAKVRPENARVRAQTDPHSPPQWRVNGSMSNLPEFQSAWQCKPGVRMARANACVVW